MVIYSKLHGHPNAKCWVRQENGSIEFWSTIQGAKLDSPIITVAPDGWATVQVDRWNPTVRKHLRWFIEECFWNCSAQDENFTMAEALGKEINLYQLNFR